MDGARQDVRDIQYRTDRRLQARIALYRFSTNPEPWSQWVFDRLRLPEDARILELGCGPAHLWKENAARVSPRWEITLTDSSPGMLDAARRTLGAASDRFRLMVCDAQAIRLDEQAFDAVIANHMLYHVSDRRRALEEVRRVLRPAGALYASTIGRTHLRELYATAGVPNELAERFGLETAGEQLRSVFRDVRLHAYDNELHVTDAAAALAHLESLFGRLGDRNAVAGAIEHDIRVHGHFKVSTAVGVFECRDLADPGA